MKGGNKNMDKEITDIEKEDFNIDELLNEDKDNPVDEEVTEETSKVVVKKGKGKAHVSTNKKNVPEIPIEVANTNKELANMKWQPYSQPAHEGFQNIETGELIDEKEAVRRTLCYAQEAARNSR